MLEHQQREADLAKRTEKEELLDLERHILARDQQLFNQERAKQLEDKTRKTNIFVDSNNTLLEMKRARMEQEVRMSD